MAERVILLGPKAADYLGDSREDAGAFCYALEMTALDADALATGGIVKVRLAQFSGQLANATVLELTDRYVSEHGGLNEAWQEIDAFLGHMQSVTRLSIKTPIPLWNGGRRRFVACAEGRHRMIPEPGDLARLLVPIKIRGQKNPLPAGWNVLVEAVGEGDDPEICAVRWIDADGGSHLLSVASTEIEATP